LSHVDNPNSGKERIISLTLINGASPLHSRASPLLTRASPLLTRASPLHSRASPLLTRASPLHLRAFISKVYKSIPSLLEKIHFDCKVPSREKL
jgi:hypothetical protein